MIFERKKYDLTFIGLGASNSLIINALFSSDLLQGLKIAVIDPDPKTKNDKTFCFWAIPEELETLLLSDLTDQYWSKLSCNGNEIEDIAPLSYYHVSSIKLYNHVRHLLSQCDVDYYRECLTGIDFNPTENLISLRTEASNFYSIKVFDSRPPQWIEGKKHQSFLWQSFLGWKIKTNKPVFDESVFTMMDFEVDQSDATQFVYILPYDKNHALVELTRFGAHPIEHEYARSQLQQYCKANKWDFTLLEEEQGMIPMCSMDIIQRSVHRNHVQTGSAAGKVKPTTGYAFKEMAMDAIRIAADFSSNNKPTIQKNHISRKGKFAFYDRLLLKIIETNPSKGKLIFTSLFKNVESRLVLKFLEQKTTFKEDVSVMLSLPKGLFIRQALKDIMSRLRPTLSFLFPLTVTLLFILLNFLDLELAGNVLLLIGLFVLGIPHGAMDHILDKKDAENITRFVVVYLLKGAAMFILWKLSIIGALLFFLIYSGWHFGQADCIRWKSQQGLACFTWGLGLLLFLLCSHAEEAGTILAQIFNDHSVKASFMLVSPMVLSCSFVMMIVSLLAIRKKWLLVSIITICLLTYIPLLQAFGIYFICQHSANGWQQIKAGLNKTDWELWKHALPFTLSALILFITLFTSFTLDWKQQVGTFFIFLSCISFPHVLKMDHFYKSSNR